MLPFFIGAVAVGAAWYAIYRRNVTTSLGSFIVWGMPNTGKTTFVAGLRTPSNAADGTNNVGGGADNPVERKKEATTSRTVYTDVRIDGLKGGPYVVKRIVDMPGTNDRQDDWLKDVKELDHAFYLVDLSRVDDPGYWAAVNTHIEATIRSLEGSNSESESGGSSRKSEKASKRLNIIGSHLDMSKWKDVDASQVNNILQEDDCFMLLFDSIRKGKVASYVYAANLTNRDSFKQLLQSIANDIRAQN
jgi:hypothetical protein